MIENSIYHHFYGRLAADERASIHRTQMRLSESFQSIKLVKTYSTEDKEMEIYRKNLEIDEKLARGPYLAWSISIGAHNLIKHCSLIAVVFVGLKYIQNSLLTPGDLSSFMLLSVATTTSLDETNNKFKHIRNTVPLCKTLFHTIDE